MLTVPGRAVMVITLWTIALIVLGWARLPELARRGVALLTSAAGLGVLVLAFKAQGQQESATTAQFLLSGGYVTGHVSASASLRYYVVTAACLLLGTIGLALPGTAAQRLERRWLASAVGLSLAVTALRFVLEEVAAPRTWTFAVGITWLAPLMGALFHDRLRQEGKGLHALLGVLLAYALAVRGAVAALMLVASSLRLGSHYDVTDFTAVRIGSQVRQFQPGSWAQILVLGVLPQLTFWVAYTVGAGLLGAGALAAFRGMLRRAATPRAPERTMAPVPPEG